ncbi:ComF family protein [Neobacillus mesonae]|nr:ComF family protein [Neobacillus mesonae]
MNRLDRISTFLHRIVAPAGDTCLACGTRSMLSKDLPGICVRCVYSIPWISQIRCVKCGRAVGCPDCSREEYRSRSFECNRSAVLYDALMREWLAVYKYRGKERYAPLFGAMLNKTYMAIQREYSFGSVEQDVKQRSGQQIWRADAVTYVPVSDERLIERGFNQAERMASELSKYQRMPMLSLLERTKHTEKQSFKRRKEREISMQHAFGVCPDADQVLSSFIHQKKVGSPIEAYSPDDLLDLNILLVDDVYTTGSTIEACSRVIRGWGQRAGVNFRIYAITWARS